MSKSDDLKPHTFNPQGVPAPPATYSHVAVTPLLPTSRLITLAGLTGCDPASSDNPRTMREQASIAYSKVQTCLAAAGASPRDIVQVSAVLHETVNGIIDCIRLIEPRPSQVKHYIVKETGNSAVDQTDIVDRGWGELWTEFLDRTAGGHRPPDTVVGVASLAKSDILYECEVWAIVN